MTNFGEFVCLLMVLIVGAVVTIDINDGSDKTICKPKQILHCDEMENECACKFCYEIGQHLKYHNDTKACVCPKELHWTDKITGKCYRYYFG